MSFVKLSASALALAAVPDAPSGALAAELATRPALARALGPV